MKKSSQFTVVVPLFFAVSLIAAQAANAITITIGSSGDEAAAKAAAALANKTSDSAVDGISQFFKQSASARYIMTGTDDGRALMSKMLGAQPAQITARSYSRFLDRVNWSSNAPLRNNLYQRLRKIDDDFAKFRKQEGAESKLGANDALSPAEIEFLNQSLAQASQDQKLADLFEHQTDFVGTVPQGFEASRLNMSTQAQHSAPGAVAPGEGGASAAVAASAQRAAENAATEEREASEAIARRSNNELARGAGASVSVLQDPGVKSAESTLAGIGVKLRTINGFFKFMRLSDGDWRSLLGMGGEDFSPNDVLMIRKLNRLMGTLNNYAKTRLTIQTFTLQSPGLYNQLNVATAADTEKFVAGEMGEQSYLEARASVAKNLGMDEIVSSAETRMVQALDQTRALGGTAKGAGDGVIPAQEAAVKEEEAKLAGAEERLKAAQESSDSKQVVLATAERDLIKTRVKAASQSLRDSYWKFVQNYEPLEIFRNLRQGRINNEPAQAFDLPDSMVASDADHEVWAQIYERALNETADKAVTSEIHDFATARIGATRAFVRDMNDDTGKLFGTKFSDSPYGTEFKNYTQSLLMTIVKRMATYVAAPAVVTTAIADPKPYENVVDKIWKSVFDEKSSDKSDDKSDDKDLKAKAPKQLYKLVPVQNP